MTKKTGKKPSPSIDAWLKEAKADPNVSKQGMFLIHNGIVRETPRAKVREGLDDGSLISSLDFSYDQTLVDEATKKAGSSPGIFHVRVWLNEGKLSVGDDIMYILIGGDIRPHVIDALTSLVETIKTKCVVEIEHTDSSRY